VGHLRHIEEASVRFFSSEVQSRRRAIMHQPQEDLHMDSMDNFRERFEALRRLAMKSTTEITKLIKGLEKGAGSIPVPLVGQTTGDDVQLKMVTMSRRFLIAVLVLSAVLMHSLPVAAQSTDPARTFAGGPLSVTVFTGTGLADAQFAVEFPIGAGEAVELITIPVNVRVPPRRRSFLVVQFVGHFQLPSIPVQIALDCAVNHELNLQFGCGITPATDLDTALPTPPAGVRNTIIPATFLIRDLPTGTHQIGVRVEAGTSQEGVTRGVFFTATSSLIVSLYAERDSESDH
jgi:hypothetical protein